MSDTLAYLYSLHKLGMKFGLRNIRQLLRYAGNPHKKFPSIHIAGTNGKGSTSSMIAAIFTAAGYNVGLYTSPHLVHFNERIRINGKIISNKDVVKYTAMLKPQIQQSQATFFEATTAMAFKYFADKQVDLAVIETGLGGRLDSTNVITPIVSVITSIGKDHVEQLGNTLSSIASEKAGIIKPRIPVVLGPISGIARQVILRRAKLLRSSVLYSEKIAIPENISVQLQGEYQQANVRCAVAACVVASNKFVLGDEAIKKGLEHTVELSGLRGRFEMIHSTPRVILDVAHNPAGIHSLVSAVKKLSYKKLVVVFGVMKDKDYLVIGKELQSLAPIIVLTQPVGERSMPVRELYNAYTTLGFTMYVRERSEDAFHLARNLAGKNGLVLVTGSHYLVGEIIQKFKF